MKKCLSFKNLTLLRTLQVFKAEHSGIRFFYYLVLIVVLLFVAAMGIVLFVPLFLGFLLAFIANPLLTHLERQGIPRGLASAITLTLGLIVMLTALYQGGIIVQNQVTETLQNWPEYEERFNDLATQARHFLHNALGESTAQLVEQKVATQIVHAKESLHSGIPAMVGVLPSVFTYGLFVPIFAVFFMQQGRDMKKWLVSLIPNRYFEMTLMIVHKISLQLGGYVRGQFWDCFFVGLLAVIGLSVVGVKGAIPIGIFAGIANAVPYMGPVMGCLPAVLSLLMDPGAPYPWWSAVVVFLVVNSLDNVLIYPMTVGKSLSLNPMIVMLGILFGGSVGGIVGMIVAVPLIGMIKQAFTVLHVSLRSYKII
jgi:predicted PurR-regulated permease PerM